MKKANTYYEVSISPPLNIGTISREFLNLFDDAKYSAVGSIAVEVHKKVFVTRSGLALKNLQLAAGTFLSHPTLKATYWRYAILNFFLRRRKKLKGKYLLIHSHWSTGYYHWLIESIPRLIRVQGMLATHTVILPSDYCGQFQHSSLEKFSGIKIEWIPPRANLLIEELVVPHIPDGSVDNSRVTQIRKAYSVSASAGEMRRKIYISRRKAKDRRVANEDDLLAVLQQKDIELLCMEDFSFDEQVNLFSQCEAVISIHGAALSNIVFMPQGGRVFELHQTPSEVGWYNQCYRQIASSSGHGYLIQFCKGSTGSPSTNNRDDIFVDQAAFASNLEILLRD